MEAGSMIVRYSHDSRFAEIFVDDKPSSAAALINLMLERGVTAAKIIRIQDETRRRSAA
jgi:hypothetical protein